MLALYALSALTFSGLLASITGNDFAIIISQLILPTFLLLSLSFFILRKKLKTPSITDSYQYLRKMIKSQLLFLGGVFTALLCFIQVADQFVGILKAYTNGVPFDLRLILIFGLIAVTFFGFYCWGFYLTVKSFICYKKGKISKK